MKYDILGGLVDQETRNRRQTPMRAKGSECWNGDIPMGTFPNECERCLTKGAQTHKICYRPKLTKSEAAERNREKRDKINAYATSRATSKEQAEQRCEDAMRSDDDEDGDA
jgi:hypothetical protein